MNDNSGFCYGGSIWLHRIEGTHPALSCIYEYIFNEEPAAIPDRYFQIDQANYAGDGGSINNDDKTVNRGGDNVIGIRFNYQTGKKDSVFMLKIYLPVKVNNYNLPGYVGKEKINPDGSAEYTYTKPLEIGLHDINQTIRLSREDPPGVWRFEFYIDGQLFKNADIKVN